MTYSEERRGLMGRLSRWRSRHQAEGCGKPAAMCDLCALAERILRSELATSGADTNPAKRSKESLRRSDGQ